MHPDWWTLGLQTANVLVLVWLLGRFLFRPVAAIVAERAAAAAKLLDDAAATRDAAGQERVEAAQARAGLDGERDRVLAEAAGAAEHLRQQAADEARTAAAARLAAGEAEIARARAAMEHDLAERAGALGVDIAGRLLGQIPPAAATAALIEALAGKIASLPDGVRATFATGTEPVRITTATALDAGQQAACRQALVALLPADQVEFSADPALLAGIELTTPHAAVRLSWQAELASIGAALRSAEATNVGAA
jgi:F-type H+-transporting ATPase subunit b